MIDLYESGSTWSDCHASEEIWDSSHVFFSAVSWWLRI